MELTGDIRYIGVNDHEVDLFEGQYAVPEGMAYNSYVILDEQTAVMDTVEAGFAEEWLEHLSRALGGRSPGYLVVQHMEPDHSGCITRFLETYPKAKIVGNSKTFVMMKQFFGDDFSDRQVRVAEGDTLCLGRHTLHFLMAPMVHWPEVMMTYDETDCVLFSADAFGRFGALDIPQDWDCEARRYYFGIVGKYGVQVQTLLKKVGGREIRLICPLHGPMLREEIGDCLRLYDTWSSYRPEDEGILIAYTSVYGHTRQAAQLLAERLRELGQERVVLTDLARTDQAEAVEDAFRYSTLVLASTTYNGGVFPAMQHFIEALTERSYQNRRVALVENGSWSPQAATTMRKLLESGRDLRFVEPVVTLRSALGPESRTQLEALAEALCMPEQDAASNTAAKAGPVRRYVCRICGYVYEGEELPADFVCPLCHHGAADFVPAD